jgi:hypothetical protein
MKDYITAKDRLAFRKEVLNARKKQMMNLLREKNALDVLMKSYPTQSTHYLYEMIEESLRIASMNAIRWH